MVSSLYRGPHALRHQCPIRPECECRPNRHADLTEITSLSYNGGVFYGLLADRDAMPDVDLLARRIEESLAELVDTVQ